MKFGDWHRTKDIVLKGHDWVRLSFAPVAPRIFHGHALVVRGYTGLEANIVLDFCS
jgi:hypothetical protein